MVEIRNRQRSVKVNLLKLRKDATHLLKHLDLEGVELSILLTNHDRIKKLNNQYRDKDRTTDVLSFPMDDFTDRDPYSDTLLGDIVINVHLAMRRSKEIKNPLHTVIRRLLVHGLLHLAGYDHEKSPYQKQKMTAKEKELFNALSELD
jgi:probable rRNA maturation factor